MRGNRVKRVDCSRYVSTGVFFSRLQLLGRLATCIMIFPQNLLHFGLVLLAYVLYLALRIPPVYMLNYVLAAADLLALGHFILDGSSRI